MGLVDIVLYSSVYLGLIAVSFFALSFFSDSRKKKSLFKDNELPKTTVIIPAYNEEKSIAPTLKSILSSDYPKDKLEIIVIDDGSTDNTLKNAKKFESKIVKIFTKTNGGKGRALNFGLKKSSGEIIVSMDADTFVDPKSLKNMVRYFKDKKVVCVSPAISIYKPKSILQRIQYVEYITGLFLRKAFASVNALHITPGAFCAYRKEVFDKYGGYDEDNITEDLEMAIRLQYHGCVIENSPESPAYTIAPSKFVDLLKQRRRWYIGLIKNTWKYKKILSPKYGDLGMFVLPVAWISILLSILITSYSFSKAIISARDELFYLSMVNFDFKNLIELNLYTIERFLFLLFTDPIFLSILLFIVVIGFYIYYASKKLESNSSLFINIPLFFIFFATLFSFWWFVSFIYVIFNRKVKW